MTCSTCSRTPVTVTFHDTNGPTVAYCAPCWRDLWQRPP